MYMPLPSAWSAITGRSGAAIAAPAAAGRPKPIAPPVSAMYVWRGGAGRGPTVKGPPRRAGERHVRVAGGLGRGLDVERAHREALVDDNRPFGLAGGDRLRDRQV